MLVAFLSAVTIVLLICVVTLAFRCHNLRKILLQSIDAGELLQNNAIQNDRELRQGLDDQAEVYEQEFLTYLERDAQISEMFAEDSAEYEQDIEALASMNENLTRRVVDEVEKRKALQLMIDELSDAHKFHEDHCLPVLNHMRAALVY